MTCRCGHHEDKHFWGNSGCIDCGCPEFREGYEMTAASLRSVHDEEHWETGALCAQVDAEIFFPDKWDRGGLAKSVCRACPVTAKCLAWAISHDEQHGIWGGMSAGERHALKRAGAAT